MDRRGLEPLIERGWIERQIDDRQLGEAALVVLALPVDRIVGALRRLPWRSGQLITDTGSAKRRVLEVAGSLPDEVSFVGGHPMAGGTDSGFEGARPGLFVDATWPLVGTVDDRRRSVFEALPRRLGARPLWCSAADHDRAVALVSHLPQLLATALAAELDAEADPLVQALVGPGARGFTRLAGSSYSMWRGILEQNGDELESALERVYGRAASPPEGLAEAFERARRWVKRSRPD